VIFVTVGTHHQRFSRLLDGLGPLAELDTLVVQHGPGPPPAVACTAVPLMSASETARHVEQARVVVTHGGVGSFLVAHRAGHVPIMVPRRRRYGEHVDDHQVALVQALDGAGLAIAVWEIDELADAVRAVPPRRDPELEEPRPLHSAVRLALDGSA
jgi:UDP-N-acetylglucosamine transferase subunit ALG13